MHNWTQTLWSGWNINGELLYQDIAELKLDELKKIEDFHIYIKFEDVEGDKNGVHIIAKNLTRFQVILQTLVKVFYSLQQGFVGVEISVIVKHSSWR